MCYYDVCRDVTTFREIEEMEEKLILPTFRKLKFVDCNKPDVYKRQLWRYLTISCEPGERLTFAVYSVRKDQSAWR